MKWFSEGGRERPPAKVEPMSGQQAQGATLFLSGLAALIASIGIAWALSRPSRARRVDSAWLITAVSVVLFALGVALCWFGFSALLGVQAAMAAEQELDDENSAVINVLVSCWRMGPAGPDGARAG